MKSKQIIGFTILGLAIGTAAYYLLATEDGKKRLNQANSGIKDLTKSLKKISKKNAKKICDMASNSKTELEEVVGK